MSSSARLVLTSFQDGRAVLDIAYGGRRARLDLDLVEDRYAGQPTAERVREEIVALVDALRASLQDPQSRIEQA
ncbi:MAG TPA: hypothetical protein VH743_01025 [Beijerinckiaceae bacterium]|jgi:hypothetical protein